MLGMEEGREEKDKAPKWREGRLQNHDLPIQNYKTIRGSSKPLQLIKPRHIEYLD
jgi:hypothetical protein